MKKLAFGILCLLGSLSAETIGNIEFQFPPSMHDWVQLFQFEMPSQSTDEDEEDEITNAAFKVYTHKVGDSLELFLAVAVTGGKQIDTANDPYLKSADFTQSFFNDTLKEQFPNHRLIINSLETTADTVATQWEVTDGKQQIVHGIGHGVQVGDTSIIFSYLTTANSTEDNTEQWIEALNQVTIVGE